MNKRIKSRQNNCVVKKGDMIMANVLEGVKCVVNTCIYHSKDDRCTANKIEIRPRNASTSDDTDCATFRPDD